MRVRCPTSSVLAVVLSGLVAVGCGREGNPDQPPATPRDCPGPCTAIDSCHVAGVCDTTTGTCTNPSAPSGTACDDGNACTQEDTCLAGLCVGGTPVTCVLPDSCHLEGACEPSTGACVNPVRPDNSACNDGNACTLNDSCQAGVCSGGSPKTCIAVDACHVSGTCDPGTGACTSPAAPEGTPCDDGNGCTTSDGCQAGTCIGGSPVACAPIDSCHAAGVCDPGTGTCSNPPIEGCGSIPPDPATVATPMDPSVAHDIASTTSFLYTQPNPIQTGVALGAIEPMRAAVVRGRVFDHAGAPLPLVVVTVNGHPEFGQTLTRTDGAFDVAVNGGGVLTLNYDRTGYLPVQRHVDVPWRDFAIVDDVVMTAFDGRVTLVDLAAASPIQIARGSAVTDAAGTRSATLFFLRGTTATANGVPLTLLNVRATEYTVGPGGPSAMPGPLPPTSGYTYAVEFSADEARGQEVRFSKPVLSYVENFIGFPVGGVVPAGYYDRATANWIASDNGRVIKILGTAGGMADLDTNGDALADDATTLATLGVSDAERQALASLYGVGQSLWRVPVTHFTPYDYNWPYGPPFDAETPRMPHPTKGANNPDDDCFTWGSVIQCQSQTLGEVLPVTGTPFRLHYGSDRVQGRRGDYTLDIPLIGHTIPASLLRIELQILIAGRRITQTFPALPDQHHLFTWDGKDAYGRTVQGTADATLRIGYAYRMKYYEPAAWARSWAGISASAGRPFTIDATGGRTASDIILWQEMQSRDLHAPMPRLGAFAFNALGLGGWSLTPHHVYDPSSKVLYMGDGRRREAQTVREVVRTAAGLGLRGAFGDGGQANQAGLNWPTGVATAPDGSFYIADQDNNRIRRVARDGSITTVAGNGVRSSSGDGGPATQASVSRPNAVAVGPDGSLYFTELAPGRVRRVKPDGSITTVAGNGTTYSGDGGPATQAGLTFPTGIAVDKDGTLFVADQRANRIRRIGADGIIQTIAGTGAMSFGGDGGPGILAGLYAPYDVALGPDGSLYISDQKNGRVRRLGTDGIISTVAGNGQLGTTGDGGPATQAAIDEPYGIAVGRDGSLYIAAWTSSSARRVSSDGVITLVAGGGREGCSCTPGPAIGDGGPAARGALYGLAGLAVAPDGTLYLADTMNMRIRHVAPVLPGATLDEIAIASEDGTELFLFTGGGRHLRTLHALTGSLRYQFAYDTTGRLASITDGDGNVTSIERDASGRPTAIVAPGGQRTGMAVDTAGWLASVANPAAETHAMTYSPDGLLRTFVDPLGRISRFDYDALGLLTRDEDAAGGAKTLARVDSPAGHSVTVTTALGRTTTYQVERLVSGAIRRVDSDSTGALSEAIANPDGTRRITFADGMIVESSLGPDPRWGMQSPRMTRRVRTLPGGQREIAAATRTVTLADPFNLLSLQTLVDTTNVNGRIFTRSYEGATRTITDTSAQGRQTVSVLDALGRVIRQELGAGVDPVAVRYDAKGRVTEASQGSQSWSYAYDARNRVLGRTDAAGHGTGYVYDDADRIVGTILPSGAAFQFSHDASGNRTEIMLPSGGRHALTYTPVHLEASYSPPANGSYQRAYDVDRQLTSKTLPGGRVIVQRYDASGRQTESRGPDAVATFGYFANDATDRLASLSYTPATGPAHSLAYAYNGGRVASVTATGAAPVRVSYAYDADFFVSSVTLTSGADTITATATRDQDGMLTGHGPFTYARTGPRGAVTRVSDGAPGTSTSYTYDSLARTAARADQVGGQAAYSAVFAYDVSGRMSGRSENTGGSSHALSYAYDVDGQLVEVRRDGTPVERYAYDANGNRTSRQVEGSALELASYDVQDRLTRRGSVDYVFDADGFLSKRGADTFGYGTGGQLLQATVGGQSISYAYDGLGRRVSRTDGGGTTQYLYGDTASHLIAAIRGSSGAFTALYYDTKGFVVALDRGGVRYYVSTDQVGSPRIVSDGAGVVVKSIDYDSFGNVVADSSPAFDLPIGFAGGLNDSPSGLVHFGFRDYEPPSGRWTSRDPAFFAGGQANLYQYVGNNPVTQRDPLGLFCLEVSGYEGVGGGVSVCTDGQHVSLCGEVGFGVGLNIGANSGGVEESGAQLVLEATYEAGPFEGGFGASLDGTGCLKPVLKGRAGPVALEYGRNGIDKGGPEDFRDLHGAPKIGAGGEAKIAGKGCKKF